MDFRIIWDEMFEAISSLSDYHLVGRHIRETAEAFEERFGVLHLIAQGGVDGQHGVVYIDTLASSPQGRDNTARLFVKEVTGRDELHAITGAGETQITKGGYILPTFCVVAATDAPHSVDTNIPFLKENEPMDPKGWNNLTSSFSPYGEGLYLFLVSLPNYSGSPVIHLYHEIGDDILSGKSMGAFDGYWLLYMTPGDTVYFRRKGSVTIPSGTILLVNQVYRRS